MDNVMEIFCQTDWNLLAAQKLVLLALVEEMARQGRHTEGCHIQGVVNWLDALQDSAELMGYPVIFQTEPTE